MHIVVIGGTGTIGQAIINSFGDRHQITSVGSRSGDYQFDFADVEAIKAFYQSITNIDALVVSTGQVHFGPLQEFTPAQFQIGIQSKLMGQVNLVVMGLQHLNPHGSFTLTSGVISADPIKFGSSAAMVNGAIDAFVKSAALEMPKQLRINSVSPTIVTESLEKYAPYFRGFLPVSAATVAQAYVKSVEGAQTGQTYQVW